MSAPAFVVCSVCGRGKPQAEIAATRPDGRSICIPCLNKQVREYPNRMMRGDEIITREGFRL